MADIFHVILYVIMKFGNVFQVILSTKVTIVVFRNSMTVIQKAESQFSIDCSRFVTFYNT